MFRLTGGSILGTYFLAPIHIYIYIHMYGKPGFLKHTMKKAGILGGVCIYMYIYIYIYVYICHSSELLDSQSQRGLRKVLGHDLLELDLSQRLELRLGQLSLARGAFFPPSPPSQGFRGLFCARSPQLGAISHV